MTTRRIVIVYIVVLALLAVLLGAAAAGEPGTVTAPLGRVVCKVSYRPAYGMFSFWCLW